MGDCHAPFCGSPGVRFPGATRRSGPPGLPGNVSNFKTDQQMVTAGDSLPEAQQFPALRVALELMHDSIHGYLGGTVGGDPHHAFHDPFVFLLHSNADRLWAMWQRAPGREWRLSPDRVYGDDRDRTNLGQDPFDSGEPITAINDNLQPWASLRHGTPGGSFGPGSSANEDWTHAPYFGTRGTFFADVTGDGRADAIVVNDTTTTVRRAT